MKNLIILISLVMGSLYSFAHISKSIDAKLLQAFSASFPNAKQIIWKEVPESYIVNFVEDEIRSSIVYEKDGTFVSSTRYYSEHNLPYYLWVTLKKQYPEKKIFGVIEVSMMEHIEYYVKLEDAKIWVTIKIGADGTLQVVEKLKKQDPLN
jgi:hypothetical protein